MSLRESSSCERVKWVWAALGTQDGEAVGEAPGRGQGQSPRGQPVPARQAREQVQPGAGGAWEPGREQASPTSSASLPLLPHLTFSDGPACVLGIRMSLCSWRSEPSSGLTPHCDRLTSQASTGHAALRPRGSGVVLAGQLVRGCPDLGSGPDCREHGEGCSEG